jgi:microtubule-associated protein 1
MGCYGYGTAHAIYLYMQFNKIPNRRMYSMKRFLMFALSALISVAFVTGVFAQAPAAPKATSAPEKAAPALEKAAAPAPTPEKKVEKKEPAKVHQYSGEVTAMDATAKTLTIKGKSGDKTFDVTDVKMKKEAKAGDKVMVKYTEKDGKMVAKSVEMKAAEKAEKKEVPKKEETKPAPTPAPAPAK